MATEIHTRPWMEADLRRLQDAEPSFSAGTLTSRFLTGSIRLPLTYLASLRRPDPAGRKRLSEVALAGGKLVGVAECTWLTDSPQPADLSVLVADSWQRRGVGLLLMDGLLRQCEAAGILRLEGVAATANAGSLALSRSIDGAARGPGGWSTRSWVSDGLRYFELRRQWKAAGGDTETVLFPSHGDLSSAPLQRVI